LTKGIMIMLFHTLNQKTSGTLW